VHFQAVAFPLEVIPLLPEIGDLIAEDLDKFVVVAGKLPAEIEDLG
jgi:hypothetical protein